MIDPNTQQPALRIRPGPQDANLRGDTFGGWLMANLDIAASITACEVAQGMTATRAVKEINFIQPIFVYDIVSFYTEVVNVGTSSITVKVEAYVQRMNALSNPDMKEKIKVSDAILVFVAINKPGEKRVIKRA